MPSALAAATCPGKNCNAGRRLPLYVGSQNLAFTRLPTAIFPKRDDLRRPCILLLQILVLMIAGSNIQYVIVKATGVHASSGVKCAG